MALAVIINANSAVVTAGATTAPAGGTVETWTVTTAANFPTLTGTEELICMDKADLGKTSGYELFAVTVLANGTGASWTATRGVEGTTPYAHAAGWTLIPVLSAGALASAFGPSSAVTIASPTFTANAYTLVLGDADTAQQASNGATAATITVPANASVAFPVGTPISITQTGAGKIKLAAAGGVTIDWAGGFVSGTTGCNAEYSTITLLKTATNTWILGGDAA